MTTQFKSNYELRSQLAFDILAEFGIATSHAIVDIMGDEQVEALVKTEMHHAGLAMALNIKNRMGLEGQDLLYVSYAANWANSIMGMDQKVEMTGIGLRGGGQIVPTVQSIRSPVLPYIILSPSVPRNLRPRIHCIESKKAISR